MKQYICVTGGAGAIGSAVVRKYAALPDTKVFVLDKVPFEDAYLQNVESRIVDVTRNQDIVAFAEELKKNGTTLAHLVCVAGGGSGEFAKLETISDEVIEDSIRLNLTSQVFLTKYLMTGESTGDRSIVFISSINALRSHGLTAYTAAKAGLIGLTRELAGSLSPYVRVNVVFPGTIPTPRTLKQGKDFNALRAKTLLGRFASPDDIAAACYFLTHMTNSITGAEIVVDAGQSVSTK